MGKMASSTANRVSSIQQAKAVMLFHFAGFAVQDRPMKDVFDLW
jgi:hypothetical protein